MEFCPTCGMLLQYEAAKSGKQSRFFCPTCPYVYAIHGKIVKKQRLPKKKEVEPVFSWEEAMSSAPKTQVTCPRCNGGEAYFRQMQIRSADEPMTIFYMCCNGKCKYEWRED
uniref:DNA-directed RNA polymerase subunit n=1 Tax=Anthurium amnicola TaxID=1678845 RepID=A0A1D1XWJ0_9ARAE